MIVRQRQPLNATLIHTVVPDRHTPPAGRAPAGGEPIPPAWQNKHAELDIATRAARGTVYHTHAGRTRRTWLQLLGLIAGSAAIAVAIGMLACTALLRWIGV